MIPKNQRMVTITFLGRLKPARRVKMFVENIKKADHIENIGRPPNKNRFMLRVKENLSGNRPLPSKILSFCASLFLEFLSYPGLFAASKSARPFLSRSAQFTRIFLLCSIFTFLGTGKGLAWVNGNFTAGLTGWTTSFSTTGGWTGVNCTPPSATVVNAGTPSAVGTGVAPNTNGQLPDHPACSPDALQLYSSRGDDNHQDWARVEQTDVVPTNGDTCLSFWFAGVFESHHYDLGQTANN